MTILGKKQMSEEDIKLNYITPVILKGWKGHITMETKITDGRINIRGNIVARSKPKFADYIYPICGGRNGVLFAAPPSVFSFCLYPCLLTGLAG